MGRVRTAPHALGAALVDDTMWHGCAACSSNVSPRGPHLRSRHSRAWLRCVVEVKGRDVSMMHNAFMKSNSANAVVYNLDTDQWQLASPVHRQAAVRCP